MTGLNWNELMNESVLYVLSVYRFVQGYNKELERVNKLR